MERIALDHTDLNVSRICLGAAGFGSAHTGDRLDVLMRAYRDAGGNFVDSAHCYALWAKEGAGCSEQAIGDYFRRNGGRDQFVVATKGGHPAAGENYPRPDAYMSPRRISADIDESLQHLGVDRIDLYYLHRDDPRMSVGEIMDMLNAEIDHGRIRYLGASNWSWQRLAKANEYAAQHALQGFVASQPEWSLAEPPVPTLQTAPQVFVGEDEIRWHGESGLPVVAYSSTANGYFARGGAPGGRFDNPVSRARLARAEQLAVELGCTPNQVALAYLMNHSFPVIPVVGTGNVEHLADAVGAAEVSLTPDKVRWLRDGRR